MLQFNDQVMFTDTVGVAPGTTTLQLNGSSNLAMSVKNADAWDPYGTESYLTGLGDSVSPVVESPIRWSLIAMVAFAVFVGVVGYGALKKHSKG